MEDSLAIANYFIMKSLDEGVNLTSMKILKLVYIAHGWHLGLNGTALITEGVEAWKYGPVVRKVYTELRDYGNNSVKELTTIYKGFKRITPTVEDADVEKFLDKVWDFYKKYSALQLSSLTHQPNTPWDIVWNKEGHNSGNAPIPNNYIEEHYKDKIKATTTS